jgi:hypothetical protein
MGIKFTVAEDEFLREHIDKCYTLHTLVDMFNANFPEHQIKYSNLGKHLAVLGIKKGTHNIRKEKVKHRNPIETVIKNSNHGARVKTENGYVSADRYFKNKYFGEQGKGKKIVHLNGDFADFSRDNLVLVSKAIYSSLQWRKWFFKDPELTRTAILTAELLEFFPYLRHNENQYYRLKRDEQ